jgi:hypothetical protein
VGAGRLAAGGGLTRIIQNGDGPDKDWVPEKFHGVHRDLVGTHKHWWRLREHTDEVPGVIVLGEDKPRRNLTADRVVLKIRDRYPSELAKALMLPVANEYEYGATDQFWRAMILAVIATESGGNPQAQRFEPKIGDWSIGLMQTLTATAAGIEPKIGTFRAGDGGPVRLPKTSVPKGGDAKEWEKALSDPLASVLLGSALLLHQNERLDLRSDPVLLYAAYNAGSARVSPRTPWGLVYYGTAMDSFVKFFNAAEALG